MSAGMLQPSQVITENARQAERLKQQRYEKQVNFQRQYEDLILETTERIRKEKSAIIEENIRNEIRNWIDTYFQQTGKIPDLPSAESGGSHMIFSRQVKYRHSLRSVLRMCAHLSIVCIRDIIIDKCAHNANA